MIKRRTAAALRVGRFAFLGALVAAAVFSQPASSCDLFAAIEGTLSPGLSDSERYAAIQLDADHLLTLQPGDDLHVHLPGVGSYSYVVVRREAGLEVTVLEAEIQGQPGSRIELAFRVHGVSGEIRTPGETFVVGYANDVHWVGVAGKDQKEEDVAKSG